MTGPADVSPRNTRRSTLGRVALPLVAATVLSACAPSFEARVARFSALPPAASPAPRSFYIEPSNQANAGGLEFGTYANLVKQQMAGLGFSEVAAPANAEVTVQLDYMVGPPRERIRSRPGLGYGGWGGGFGGFGGWGRGWGGLGWGGWNPYWGGGWGNGFGGFGGWGGGWGAPEVYSVTEYNTVLALKMVRNADKSSLFEGRADTASRSNNLPALMPSLVRAMFTDFPGNNGQTVRVRFDPNNPASPARVNPVR